MPEKPENIKKKSSRWRADDLYGGAVFLDNDISYLSGTHIYEK